MTNKTNITVDNEVVKEYAWNAYGSGVTGGLIIGFAMLLNEIHFYCIFGALFILSLSAAFYNISQLLKHINNAKNNP